jgi:hypothetical protein
MGACSILFVLLRMLCQQKLCFCARLLLRAWLSHLPGTMQDDDAAFGDSFAAAFHRQLSLASPLQGGSSSDRRASLATPGQRRLSAVQQPESHPVSPAASDRGGGGSAPSPLALLLGNKQPGGSSGSQGPSPSEAPALSHFSIPAYSGSAGGAAAAAAVAPTLPPLPPQLLAGPAEGRVTLNLFVQDPEHPQGEEGLRRLHTELSGMRSCVGLLQEQLAEARQQAAAAAAAALTAAHAAQAAEPASSSGGVTLVLNVSEPAPAPAAEAAETAPTMQLLLNIVDPPPAAEPRDAGEGSGAAPADAAALQQQLQRVEACREELARQAGQLRGRIAKVGWWGCRGA